MSTPLPPSKEGDCLAGDKGSWPAARGGGAYNISDLESCVRHCHYLCPRCSYVSYSAGSADCSWYARCDLARLNTRFRGVVTRAVVG